MNTSGSRASVPAPALKAGQVMLSAVGAGVILLLLAAVGPGLLGNRTFVVQGGSMEPTIPLGSAVVTQPVPTAALKVGDVITYAPSSGWNVTHRIIQVVQDQAGLGYRTQGDANETPDPELVRPSTVLGRVWYYVPLAGYLLHLGGQTITLLALAMASLSAAMLLPRGHKKGH